jgi:Stage II sporulation protein E (SpoIIE)
MHETGEVGRFRRWLDSPSRRDRRAYWASIPMKELRYLMIAVFLLFGMYGFLSDVTAKGRLPLAAVLMWATISGGMAVLYVVAFARKITLLPFIFAVQVLLNIGAGRITAAVQHSPRFRAPTMDVGLAISVGAIWTMSLASYIFFLVFIQTAAKRAMIARRELELAQGIQATLAPRISYRDERFEVHALTLPSEKVGGDVVDLVVRDGVVFCYVADVSGHGLQAGILMGMVKTAGRTLLLDDCGLGEMQDKMNRVLPSVKEQNMYMTFAGLRFAAGDQVEYASAGHPPMLHWRAATGDIRTLGVEQLPIGMFEGVEYRTSRAQYGRGDLFVITTDGVLEAENAAGEEFSMARLAAVVGKNADATPERAVDEIVQAVKGFGKQTDDQTILFLRVL